MDSRASICADIPTGGIERQATCNDLSALNNACLCIFVHCLEWGVLNEGSLDEHAPCLVNGCRGGSESSGEMEEKVLVITQLGVWI